jgi:PAS domain S-box-containing protein
MKPSIRNVQKAWLTTVVLTTSVGLLGTVWAARAATEGSRVSQSIWLAERWLSELKDNESRHRGYVLTGDPQFLQGFESSELALDLDWALLRGLIEDPMRLQKLDQITPAIRSRRLLLAEAIKLQREGQPEAARALIGSRRGLELMNSIRRQLEAFEQQEQRLAAEHLSNFRVSLLLMLLTMLAGAAGASVVVNRLFRDHRRLHESATRDLALHRALLDSAEFALISLSATGVIQSFNRGAEQLTGFSAAEVVSKPFMSLTPTAANQAEAGAWFAAYCRDSRPSREEVWLGKAGERLAVSVVLSTLVTSDDAKGFAVHVRDLASLERARSALRESEARNRSIIEATTDHIMVLSLDGALEYLSPQACHRRGIPKDSNLGGVLWPTLWAGPAQAAARQALVRAARGEKAAFEAIDHEGAGEPWWDVVVTPIYGPAGNPAKLLVLERDVSERRAAQQELLESGAYLGAMIDAVGEGIITLDEHGLVESANAAAARLFGYGQAELRGVTFEQLIEAEGAGTRPKASTSELRQDSTSECRGRRRDGSTFAAETAMTVMRRSGRRHVVVVTRDISRRKEHERKLVEAMVGAERANAAKDIFLSTMSHEIRTPLSALLGTLELLGLTSLDGVQRESVATATDSGRALVRIIDDILDFAKLEAGQLRIVSEPVAITALLQRLVGTYKALAQSKGLKLLLDVDSRLTQEHLVDPVRLAQIIGNFVSNAIKFTDRGEVTVKAELTATSSFGEVLRFTVSDTGVGISAEEQALLFRPFQQGDASRSRGGTGLGLSICARLSEMMGASLDIKSTPRSGTHISFTIRLTLARHPTPIQQEFRVPTPVSPTLDTASVLLVDDNAANRKLVARQFQALGLPLPHLTGAGLEALQVWKGGRFALVLTDLNMPLMDGYALARELRAVEEHEKRPRTPIVAWTASVLSHEAEACRAAGIDDVLTKPTDLFALKAMLMKWMTGGAPR